MMLAWNRGAPDATSLRAVRCASFALGGLLGAAGAVAAVRRLRRSSLSGQAAGLAAFEDAPCFLEHARAELDAGRDPGALGHGPDPA